MKVWIVKDEDEEGLFTPEVKASLYEGWSSLSIVALIYAPFYCCQHSILRDLTIDHIDSQSVSSYN